VAPYAVLLDRALGDLGLLEDQIVYLQRQHLGEWLSPRTISRVRKAMPRLRGLLLKDPALKPHAWAFNQLLDGAMWDQDVSSRTADLARKLQALGYGSFINSFLERASSRGHDHTRCWHGVYRALSPLVEGGLEFSVDELQEKGWLKSFLRASFEREAILLRRAPDHKRAHELVTSGRADVAVSNEERRRIYRDPFRPSPTRRPRSAKRTAPPRRKRKGL